MSTMRRIVFFLLGMTAGLASAQVQEPPARPQRAARERPALVEQSVDALGNNVCRFEDGKKRVYGNQACPPFFNKASAADNKAPCAVEQVPPEFDGIWATEGALKNGVNRIVGAALYIEPQGTCISVGGPPGIGGPIHIELAGEHALDLWAVQGDERIDIGRATYDPQTQSLSLQGVARGSRNVSPILLHRVGDFDLAAKKELRLK